MTFCHRLGWSGRLSSVLQNSPFETLLFVEKLFNFKYLFLNEMTELNYVLYCNKPSLYSFEHMALNYNLFF